jgi:hypothetical protein
VTKILNESAFAIANHGFASEFGNVDSIGGWNGLVEVSAVLLDNLGEHDLANEYRTVHGAAAFQVWIHQATDGTKSIKHMCRVSTRGSHHMALRFDRADRALSAITDHLRRKS